MGVKDQLSKIKDNWLIIAVIIVLLMFMNFGSLFSGGIVGESMKLSRAAYDMADDGYYAEEALAAPSYYGGGGDFAPEVEQRKITKTTSLATEIERGTFTDAQQKVKSATSLTSAIILNENENKYGTDKRQYHQGSYQIKVDTEKYDTLVEQLKAIGEVQSFNENARDITGQYTNTEIEITTEKARLARYHQLYAEAEHVNEKLDINDRIFDQERRIGYLEDSLERLDQRVEYSTVHFTITEKQSDYASVVWVKLSSLIKSFVSSFNTLVTFIFVIVPWAVAYLIIRFVYKLVKRE